MTDNPVYTSGATQTMTDNPSYTSLSSTQHPVSSGQTQSITENPSYGPMSATQDQVASFHQALSADFELKPNAVYQSSEPFSVSSHSYQSTMTQPTVRRPLFSAPPMLRAAQPPSTSPGSDTYARLNLPGASEVGSTHYSSLHRIADSEI